LLDVRSIDVAYGEVAALRDVSLTVNAGEIVSVLGANGAGKTTLLRTVSGLLSPRAGSIIFKGRSIEREPAYRIVRAGISHLPEGRGILGELTVIENLRLGAYLTPKAESEPLLRRVFRLFPVLERRQSQQAAMLSGGEQQMLALGRSLLSKPALLMIDELSLGLAPKIVRELMELLVQLREQGLAILLVEQNVRQTLKISDRVYVLVNGQVVFHGKADTLRDESSLLDHYLGTG
jgi:branched-chain amino acid transport system ATP-binding protein